MLKDSKRESIVSMFLMISAPLFVLAIFMVLGSIFHKDDIDIQKTVSEAIKAGKAIEHQVSIVCIGEEPYIRDEDGEYFKSPRLSGYDYIRSLCTK